MRCALNLHSGAVSMKHGLNARHSVVSGREGGMEEEEESEVDMKSNGSVITHLLSQVHK